MQIVTNHLDAHCPMVQYGTVTNAAQGITAYGRGALTIELNICNAYRIILINTLSRQATHGNDMERSDNH